MATRWKHCWQCVGVLTAFWFFGCGADTGGQDSYFRFTLDGQDFEVEQAEMSVMPVDAGRYLVLISSRSNGGSEVSLMVRMELDPSKLEGLTIEDRHIRADQSGTFVLITEGQAGASFIPGSTLTMEFNEVMDGFIGGSFQAGGLGYSASFSDISSTPVNASGSFRLPVTDPGA